jgi:ABC-type branched-subunit amino acid transport system ATPase component
LPGGVEDDARSLAIQVGLAKAIRDYDLKRVITFHSKISLAKNFASSFNEFKDHLKEDQRPSGSITYEHVSGKMPTSERSNKLRALRALEDEDRYLLANARCLSEGVDVLDFPGFARHLIALKCNSIGDGITLLNQAHDTKVLLVERKFAFAHRVGKDFHLTEKGQVVASGEIEQLTDEFI